MGSTKTTQTTNIPGASGNEQQLMSMLSRLAQQFGGSFGDLSGLARGDVGGPSQQDLELSQQSIGRTGEMAQRELERILGPALAKLGEGTAGRNIAGSSMEQLNKLLQGREISDQVRTLLSGAQQQQGQALMNLPFQRAELKLGANQTLFNMLQGAANPVLANQLQSRLANQTTTTEQGFSPLQLMEAFGGLGFKFPFPSNKNAKKEE